MTHEVIVKLAQDIIDAIPGALGMTPDPWPDGYSSWDGEPWRTVVRLIKDAQVVGSHGTVPVSDSEPVGTERSAKNTLPKSAPEVEQAKEMERLTKLANDYRREVNIQRQRNTELDAAHKRALKNLFDAKHELALLSRASQPSVAVEQARVGTLFKWMCGCGDVFDQSITECLGCGDIAPTPTVSADASRKDEKKDLGAALLPADPPASPTTTEALPTALLSAFEAGAAHGREQDQYDHDAERFKSARQLTVEDEAAFISYLREVGSGTPSTHAERAETTRRSADE
jgi:hypothetical protein